MTRRRYVFDEAKVGRFLRQRRGEGEGPAYRPWLTVRDISSRGRSHREPGVLTQRTHHLLSDGEWKSFLMLEQDPSILDIREQFPMDRLRTHAIARRLGYRPPVTLDGTPYVLTIDFFVTQRAAAGVRYRPLTFKYSFDDLAPRGVQLLHIAQQYWEDEGLELERIDQSFYDEEVIKKWDRVRGRHIPSALGSLPSNEAAALVRAVIAARACHGLELTEFCRQLADATSGTPMAIFNGVLALLAHRYLYVDLRGSLPLELYPMSRFEMGVR